MGNKGIHFRYYLPIIFALVLLTGMWAGTRLAPHHEQPLRLFLPSADRYDKVSDLIRYITGNYVDSVSKEQLSESAIEGILENLDPHSQYVPAESLAEVNEQLMGNFEGIGIQFRIENDTITVIQTISGGPSEKLGLLAGDRIVKVGDSLVAGTGIRDRDVISMLKGPRGTRVDVSIFRRGVTDLLEFTITRDVIPTYSIDMFYMPADTIGYIKVSKFSNTTYEEYILTLKTLLSKGMTSLILDLRGNTGGYMQAAIQMADEFLQADDLIVYTEGNNRPRTYSYATRKGMFETQPLLILINEGSASASEIVAGAVQDNDRGLIIGRRSFGKGLVQEQLSLSDGSAVRLTIARYYTPSGRSIQRPYQNGSREYYDDFFDRFVNGEMSGADSIHFDDSLKYSTKGGKTVYGGGGITPDIFVPYNASDYPEYYNKLLDRGLIFQYAFNYTDTHRGELAAYASFDDFNNNFHIGPAIFNDFVEWAATKGVEKNGEGIRLSSARIKTLMKAFIARNLYDDYGFYPIYHQIDETMLRAMEFFRTGR